MFYTDSVITINIIDQIQQNKNDKKTNDKNDKNDNNNYNNIEAITGLKVFKIFFNIVNSKQEAFPLQRSRLTIDLSENQNNKETRVRLDNTIINHI